MKHTLIFSDVHLKAIPSDRARHLEFAAWLRSHNTGRLERLICLGDLFDFWYEYRSVIFSDYFEVLRAFAELRDNGVALHLICGNHDFWAGRFLEEIGFNIHPNTVDLTLGALRVHCVHGDGINPRDHGYHVYKKIARNRVVTTLFRWIHPDNAMYIARGVSHGSRTYLSHDDPAEGPEAVAVRDYARRMLESGQADVVLCGHTHAATREAYGDGVYINPGDWMVARTYTLWDGAEFHMRRAGAAS